MEIETIEYRGFYIHIHTDEMAEDPRKEFDQMGKMVCWSRYTLGDEQPKEDPQEWLKELACEYDDRLSLKLELLDNNAYYALREKYGHEKAADKVTAMGNNLIQKSIEQSLIILPLYLYDHSGITMSTSSFSCPWDSGQVGYVYMSVENAVKEYGTPEKQAVKHATEYLKGEVQEYDQFLRGCVYGYVIEPKETNKLIECNDSCWGFYGDTEYVITEAKSVIEWEIENYRKKVRAEVQEKRTNKDKYLTDCLTACVV